MEMYSVKFRASINSFAFFMDMYQDAGSDLHKSSSCFDYGDISSASNIPS